ncbi:MAG: toll/interleukin-1 receptor domain-containing protein, partial [Acidobacteriota bacterium]
MDHPVVFVSYSHDSAEHRKKVLGLAQRLRMDGIDIVLDEFVEGTPEQGWPRWMLDELDRADFVLVVCTETYYRRFRGHEEPGRGRGVDWEGAIITNELYRRRSRSTKFMPVLLDEANQGLIPEPLQGFSFYSPTSEEAYQQLYKALRGKGGVEPAPLGELQPIPEEPIQRLRFESRGAAQRVAPSKLPPAPAQLFGRDDELARLDAAWDDPATHVVTLVAWGGVGKTSLVGTWIAGLAARKFDGADYFDWSFYSQGTRDQGTASADAFVDAALRFFGDSEMAESPRAPWDKGSRLAELVAARRTLLVLDGLEPLQYSPASPLKGELKDDAVKSLLRGLAACNAGLCVVTTREPVADLSNFQSTTAPERPLGHLSIKAGVALLESIGVKGARSELEALVNDVRGHALTLNLLGRFLHEAFDGDVRRRDQVNFQEADVTTQGGHAFRVMEAYERWLETGGEVGKRQLAILRLLGLFDRPADVECLAALRCPPAIAGLTDMLVALRETQWNQSVSRLDQASLLIRDDESLDAHPLVREHFARRLKYGHPKAWKAAHSRLFDHLKNIAEYRPDTLQGLQPLYQAVLHGCRAGRQPEARAEVYSDRILRGTRNDGFYSIRKLGAISTDLAAIACFFEEPWRRVSPSLREIDQAWMLNEAATRMGALGRLREAVEPLKAALAMSVSKEDCKNAARQASNLSEMQLNLGELASALSEAEKSVYFADRIDDEPEQVFSRTALANVLQKKGRQGEARRRFREAESIQTKWNPTLP